MKTIKKSWGLGLIVATILLLSPFISLGQSDSTYCFNPSEIKEIAYRIKSREILLKDTSLLRSRIRLLERSNAIIDSIYQKQKKVSDMRSIMLNQAEKDILSLSDYSSELEDVNSKLNKKIKITKYAIPISFGLGMVLTLLITK